jgi:ribulose kinase
MHADWIRRVSDAPALGCAILAAVAAGLHPNIVAAVEAMVHVSRVIQPDAQAHHQYQRYYRAYKALVRGRPLAAHSQRVKRCSCSVPNSHAAVVDLRCRAASR